MPDPKSYFHLNPKVPVAITVALLFVLGLVQIAQGRIDTGRIRGQIQAIVKEKTGKELKVRGQVSVSLLPMPVVYLPGVELRDGGKIPTPAVTADMVQIHISWTTIFSDRPAVTGVALQHPVLELDRAADGKVHWDWLNPKLLAALSDGKAAPVSLDIADGKIVYHSAVTDAGAAIENIDVSGRLGPKTSLSGALAALGRAFRFSVESGGDATDPNVLPMSLRFYADDKNKFEWQGKLDTGSGAFKAGGAVKLELQDMMAWVKPPSEEEKPSALSKFLGVNAKKEETGHVVLPIVFSGDGALDGWKLSFSNITLAAGNSTGGGTAGADWTSAPVFTVAMDFDKLDCNQWKPLAADLFWPKPDAAGVYKPLDEQAESPLPKDITLNLKASAKEMLLGGESWQNAKIAATLDDAVLTVNQFNIEKTGQLTLSLFGVVSQGAATGLRFDGGMETEGKSLRQLLTMMNASAAELPELGLGAYSMRSNLFISSEQLRLSEADVKINDLRLNGGLVAYYDANPRVEADVKLKDINFDYFRDMWRKQRMSANPHDFFLKFDPTLNFNWLRQLQTSVDFRVSVDHFTFLEREGENASFRLFARDGQFGIYDLRLTYPNTVVEAGFTLEAKELQPKITLMLNADEINTDYFLPVPDAAPPEAEKPKERWSQELIDTSWMNGVSGMFDLSIGKLVHGGRTFNNAKIKVELDGNVLAFQNVSFDYWQGQCAVGGTFFGGKVPGFAISFTVYDADLHDMLQSAAGRDNITGRVSASGTASASGVNIHSWLSQSEAKIAFAGRGVTVQGFNLQGVTDAVAAAHTAADVVNNVNRELVDGSTVMSVDGNINVKNAVLRSPGITLKTDEIVGNLTGEVRLLPWTMELSQLYQFPAMTSETVPTMTVRVAGPIDALSMQTDTASLEAYVAKRIVGR